VLLQHAGGDDERFGVHQAGGDAAGHDVQVAVEEGDALELSFVVGVDELELLAAIFGGERAVLEIVVTVLGVAGGGFGDDPGALEALGEIIEDAAQRAVIVNDAAIFVHHLDGDGALGSGQGTAMLADMFSAILPAAESSRAGAGAAGFTVTPLDFSKTCFQLSSTVERSRRY
jgi:hypothetical protein